MMEAPEQLVQVGRYRVLSELGQGAMAQVYLAELATFGGFRRKVALKVVRSEFARDPKFAQLMAREAMIGSLLQHPNIVETLEFNEADGRMFLALEFVEGKTVEGLLEEASARGEKGLSLDLALEIIVQVLKGLHYAHNLLSPEGEVMGIIHRDLKPGNIMVSRHGVVKVMDFGIAKAKIACATITAAGQVRGTPIYMAPEQVTGKPLDGRCDQFAAATVLYELVTGQQVFIARNLIEIMRRVSRSDVGDSITHLEECHPGLGEIAARMWSVNSHDRYPDCEEPAREIEDLLPSVKAVLMGGVAPAPPPPTTTTPAPRKRQRSTPRAEAATSTPAREEDPPRKGLFSFLGWGRKKELDKKRRKKRRRRSDESGRMKRPGESGDMRRPGESGGMRRAGETGGRKRKRKRRPEADDSQPGATRTQSGVQPAAETPPKAPEPAPPSVEPPPPPEATMDATEPLGPAQLRPAATLTDDVDGELESMGGKLRADPVLARLSQVAPQREATTDSPAVDESLLLVWEESTFGSSSSEAIPPVTDSVEPVQPNPPAAPTRPDADETDDGDSGDGDSGDGDSSPMGPFFFED